MPDVFCELRWEAPEESQSLQLREEPGREPCLVLHRKARLVPYDVAQRSPCLLRLFADVGDSSDDVLAFARAYGLLEGATSESVRSWRARQEWLRHHLALWDALAAALTEAPAGDPDVLEAACTLTAGVSAELASHATLSVAFTAAGKESDLGFRPHLVWRNHNLWGALVVQLWLSILERTTQRRCGSCGSWLSVRVGSGAGRKTCSLACRLRQHRQKGRPHAQQGAKSKEG